MKTEMGEVMVATGPHGDLEPRPSVMIGKGLVVARLGPSREYTGEYTITHAATGYRIGEAFCSQRLAIRCTEEIIRRHPFTEKTAEAVLAVLKPVWESVIKPIIQRYQDYDEVWFARGFAVGSND